MKRILLADDSITIQKVVELTFSDGDYEVVCVSNGAQALKKIPEFRPDVMLLDVVMPEKNGYEVCEEVRRDPATASIPVLLLTGTFEPFDEKRAAAVGASGHLTKPFESHSLVALVEQISSAPPATGVAEPNAAQHPQPIPDPAPTPAAAPAAPEALAMSPESAPWSGSVVPAASIMSSAPPREEGPPLPPPAPPDPTDGGSFRGADHLGLESREPEIIPGRYEEPDPALTTTERVNRAELIEGKRAAEAPVPQGAGKPPAPPMEGFVGGYDFPAGSAPPPTPAPSAPGGEEAEIVSVEAEPLPPGDAAPEASGQQPEAPAEPSVAERDTPAAMTPDDIDRIAQQVVRHLSDRVVREIAWEVIPQVAEALVRERIREIEKQGDD